jgi:hypothetical protein
MLTAALIASLIRLVGQLEPVLQRAVHQGRRVVIYCPSGCDPCEVQPGARPNVERSAGNSLGELVPEATALLGMVRMYATPTTARGFALPACAATGTWSHAATGTHPEILSQASAAQPSSPRPSIADVPIPQRPSIADDPIPQRPSIADEISAPSPQLTSSSLVAIPSPEGGGVPEGEGAPRGEAVLADAMPPDCADFAMAMERMEPVLRRALMDDAVDEDGGEALTTALAALLRGPGRPAQHTRSVVTRKRALTAESCAALRRVIDSEMPTTARDGTDESEDGLAQQKLRISVERLIELTSRSEIESLWRLADEVLALQRQEAYAHADAVGKVVPVETAAATEAAHGGFHVDLFLRRYTLEGRPWIAFHRDVSGVTLNVALSDDGAVTGGRLHAILGGRHRILTREEGEVTGHSDDLMHAVSAIRAGVRYSLIALFFVLREDDECVEYQTIPRRELYPLACGEGTERRGEHLHAVAAASPLSSRGASSTLSPPPHTRLDAR